MVFAAPSGWNLADYKQFGLETYWIWFNKDKNRFVIVSGEPHPSIFSWERALKEMEV